MFDTALILRDFRKDLTFFMDDLNPLSWLEINKNNLKYNYLVFKKKTKNLVNICPVIKANAYGHGLKECAFVLEEIGTDFLGVNCLSEALELRKAGVKSLIYILGYVREKELGIVIEEGFHLIIYDFKRIDILDNLSEKIKKEVNLHLKIETGNNRQGLSEKDLMKAVEDIEKSKYLQIKGIATHFANIEDTEDQSYAKKQLKKFKEIGERIEKNYGEIEYKHCANTAASLIFPETYFNFIRPGIGIYGLWPSEKVKISNNKTVKLKPVLSWKTIVGQVKKIEKGEYIGYGCSYQTTKETVLAVLPVGYYDGYDRKLSNKGYALIKGQKAPIRGRICMNMTIVDVTDIKGAKVEDEVVLLGSQKKEVITADQIATWMDTINYEVVSRIREGLERRVV